MSDPSASVFAVVGPGAVGGLLAWLLQHAGHEVVAVGRPATVGAIRAQGIRVRSETFGDAVQHIRADTAVPSGASVIVATKAYGLQDVLPGITRAEPTEVLSLLNGVEQRMCITADDVRGEVLCYALTDKGHIFIPPGESRAKTILQKGRVEILVDPRAKPAERAMGAEQLVRKYQAVE